MTLEASVKADRNNKDGWAAGERQTRGMKTNKMTSVLSSTFSQMTTRRRVIEREKEKEGGGAKETDGTQRENDDSETSDRKRKRRGGRKKWTDENRKGKKVQGMRKRTRAGNGKKN